LAIGQVSDELIELISSVYEVGVVDDFAKKQRDFLGAPYYAD
jgi:hypothetical protein